MLNEFIARIEKAKKPKQLGKIEQEARKQYGLWSKEYGKILDLCYNKLEILHKEK